MGEELLVCSNLTKRFGRKEVLKDVALCLESGKIIGLLGPNGSGKTTLIKLMNGLFFRSFRQGFHSVIQADIQPSQHI